MVNNTSNWGFNFVKPSDSLSTYIVNIYGCNQVLRSLKNIDYIITAIPIVDIQTFEKECSNFSLQKYIDLLNRVFPGNNIQIVEPPSEKIKFTDLYNSRGNSSSDDWIFRNGNGYIGNLEKIKQEHVFVKIETPYNTRENVLYYYIFCLLRHIYYYQQYFKEEVVNNIQDFDTETPEDFFDKVYSFCSKYRLHYSLFRGYDSRYSLNKAFFHHFITNKIQNEHWNIYYSNSNSPRVDLFKKIYFSKTEKSQYYFSIDNKYYYLNYYDDIKELNIKEIDFDDEDMIDYSVMSADGSNFYVPKKLMLFAEKKVKPLKKMKPARILSRHPSHNVFRKNESLYFEEDVLIRLGSKTNLDKIYDVEINSIDSIETASNKYRMKVAFNENEVPTADWYTYSSLFEIFSNNNTVATLPYPIIAKNIHGSKGRGNYKLDTPEEMSAFLVKRADSINNFIFEKYYNYAKEYRVHVNCATGAFLVWRKLRRSDTPDNKRWFFNNENCNWVSQEHELFDEPKNFDSVLEACSLALKAVGLDIGGCDVRIQSNKNDNPKFIVVEINSACSQGEITSQEYIKAFRDIVKFKSKS